MWKAGATLLLVEARSMEEVLLEENRLKFKRFPNLFPKALKFSGGIITLTFLLEPLRISSKFLFSMCRGLLI